MKLLFCPYCSDVFKLSTRLRSCNCGTVKGKYLADRHKAVVNGKGMSLAFNNRDVFHAYHNGFWEEGNMTRPIECWARPHDGKFNPNTEIDEDL